MIAIDLDTGFRYGAFDTAATYYVTPYAGIQAEFIDEGKQPQGIKNVNKIFDIDAIAKYSFSDLYYLFAKGGITSSYFSYNGSGNEYSNNTGFTGGNIGVGVGYELTDTWSVQAQVVASNYQQSDKTAYETFEYASIGLQYEFGK